MSGSGEVERDVRDEWMDFDFLLWPLFDRLDSSLDLI